MMLITGMPMKTYYLVLSQPLTKLPGQLVSIAEHKRNGGPSQRSACTTLVPFKALKITPLRSSSSSKANIKRTF
jgi:hypothetical protein